MTPEQLRELGLNLIPCRPKSKLPAIPWGQYQTEKYNGSLAENNAVICGVTSGNLIVVDLDDPTLANIVFKDWEKVLNSTLVVETGKKGYHIYFRVAGNLPRTSRVNHPDGRHLDIQSQGAYVVAPGSIHPDTGKEYRVISHTASIIQEDVNPFLDHLVKLGFTGVNEALPPIKDLLHGVPEGNRNNATFKYAAFLIGNLGLPDDMVLAEIKRWATYLKFTPKPGELEAVVKSALKRVKRPQNTMTEVLEDGELMRLRRLSAKFEGQEVEFGAYIAFVDALTTVTTLGIAKCPKCGCEEEVTSEGYVNPKIPRCVECKINQELTKKVETIDMREIYLQELPEDINYSNPLGFKARVIGDNVNKIHHTMRARVLGRFVSFNDGKSGKQHNEPVILIKKIESLEEPTDLTLPKETLEELGKDENLLPKLVKSFAPKIKGQLHEVIKETLLLAAVRGTEGMTKRNRINVIMIGNAARGKTELQKEFANLTGGSVIVGYNATKAGLGTGTIKLPDGTSIPKPGALVTHNKKSLCVDEQDKMHSDDIKALYESMEDGIITAAKANMVGEEKNPADTTIVGGANFRYGNFDPDQSIMDNIPESLTEALITRYSSVFRILDYDEYIQSDIADSLLGLNEEEAPPFDFETLRMYINSVKTAKPGISKEARLVLKSFYMRMTKKKTKDDMPMEPRQLIDLLNMTTALAKLLQHTEATVKDAEHIVEIYGKQLESWGEGVKSIQSSLIPEEQTRMQTLMGLVNSCKDENGHFGKESVLDKWEKTKYFKDRRSATKFFDDMSFLMDRSGKYYESSGGTLD